MKIKLFVLLQRDEVEEIDSGQTNDINTYVYLTVQCSLSTDQ